MSIDPVSLAITAALTATQMAINATRKIEGPRTEDLNVTVADYGTPLNYFYGTRRFQGTSIIWAEQIRETKKRRKTKGGKTNEYRYYGTWAIVIADHAIDAVTRIWFDKHLVYDATGIGPISALHDGDLEALMRVYLGTPDQMPDPRMQATIEAQFGAGSCPAYRDVAYIVFEEVPLEKFGNRIPQQSVEAVSNATFAFPYEQVDTTFGANSDFAISAAGTWMAYFTNGSSSIEWWNLPTRTRLGTSPDGGVMASSQDMLGIADDGTVYYMGPRIDGVDIRANYYSVPPLGTPSRGPNLSHFPGSITRAFGSGGTTQVYTNTTNPILDAIGGWFVSGEYQEAESAAVDFFIDSDDDVWGIFQPLGASSDFALKNMTQGGPFHFFTGLSARGAPTSARGCQNASGDLFVSMDGDWYRIDPDSMTITDSGAAGWGSDEGNTLPFNRPGKASFWAAGFDEYSLTDGSLIRSVDSLDWVFEDSHRHQYDWVNHAFISRPQFDDHLTWRFLDRVSGSGITLATIVSDVCNRSNIDSGSYDASALTQTILGFGWTQAAGKSIVEPLLDLYDSVCRPHDFDVQFIKRSGTSGGTLDVGEFVASEGDRYSITVAQDTDLPRGIALSFADPDADQQPNTVIVQRPLDNVDSVRQASLDMTTLVLDKDEARQLSERWFRRQWNSRETYNHGLTAQQMALEPADVRTLTLDGLSRTAELQKLTFRADDTLLLEWRRDFSSLSAVASELVGAAQDGRVESVILFPMESKALVLDIPLLRDTHADDSPLLYVGASPYGTGFWPGAVMYQQEGEEYDLEVASFDSSSPSVWGKANGALTSATHYVWDRGNSVNVTLYYGSLTSASEANCNANPQLNLALLGDELIQFTTATLQGDGSYTLTGLKRGRRGTEWAVGTHATGERFVMVAELAAIELSGGDIGEDLSFKAATFGRDVDTAVAETVTDYSAAANRPWAPDLFKAKKDSSSGDWTFACIRRSRVAGDFAPGVAPLGESVESYKLKIYNGSSVVRTITSSSDHIAYTNAQQVTDFGSGQSTVKAGILQVGDLADGFERVTTFTGSTYG